MQTVWHDTGKNSRLSFGHAYVSDERYLAVQFNIIFCVVFYSLWPPYVIGQAIIFSSCGFFLLSFFLLSFFFLLFSSPNVSGRRLDVYHTSTHNVARLSANLECRSECAARGSLEIQDA